VAGGELRAVQLMFNTTYAMVFEKENVLLKLQRVEMVFRRSTGTWRSFPPHSASSPS
jgi:hypothetical protein